MKALSIVLLLSLIGGSAAAISEETKDLSWLAASTAVRISPASARPGDLTATWKGVDGLPVQVVVSEPRPAHGIKIELSPVAGDNGPALMGALGRLHKSGGGELHLTPGIYRLDGDKSSKGPLLSIDGQSDVTISGKGATLLLMRWGKGISINNSQRVRLLDLEVRYAAPALVTAKVVKDADGIGILIDPSKVPGSGPFPIHQMTTMNPQGAGYSIHGTRAIFGKDGVMFSPAGAGRYNTGDKLNGFETGDRVAVKLTYYEGSTIVVDDKGGAPASDDITIDDVTIGNASGMGIVAERMGRGLAIVNSHIGPVTPADDVVSVGFDGIHVSAAAGDILIRNNHISGTADDGINLASPILDVVGLGSGGTFHIQNASLITPGETIGLFDEELHFLGEGTATGREPQGSDGASAVHIAGTISNMEKARYARGSATLGSRYAVIGNTISDCECHGLLAQGPNGLISGNTFNGLRYNAIRLLTSGMWKEGSGATNVVVKDNVIRNAGAETKPGFVWAAITAYGEIGHPGGRTHMPPGPVNSELLITHNTVMETQDACISISGTENATLSDNKCDHTMLAGPPKLGNFPSAPGSDAARSRGIWIDPQTTSNVRLNK